MIAFVTSAGAIGQSGNPDRIIKFFVTMLFTSNGLLLYHHAQANTNTHRQVHTYKHINTRKHIHRHIHYTDKHKHKHKITLTKERINRVVQ